VEVAVVVLSVAILVLSVAVTALGATLPFLWWKVLDLQRRVETLDEALTSLVEQLGVPKE
jgi:Flp pilus assembly protein TadB